jgi:hypothetical protein
VGNGRQEIPVKVYETQEGLHLLDVGGLWKLLDCVHIRRKGMDLFSRNSVPRKLTEEAPNTHFSIFMTKPCPWRWERIWKRCFAESSSVLLKIIR